jgi:hypothetical protein
MPTPVGPVPRDPNDPELWEEWDEDDGDDEDVVAGPGYGWPIRLLALLVVIGIAALYIFSL